MAPIVLFTLTFIYLLFMLSGGIKVEYCCGKSRLIYFGYGKCHRGKPGDAGYELHYNFGKLYPVELKWGELVQPGQPAKESGCGDIWMCEHHAAEWLGYNPRTGQKYAWGLPVPDDRTTS